MTNFFVLSLGGSLVSLADGLNIDFLKKFKKLIEKRVEMGDKFIIVVGGGFLARDSIKEASRLSSNISSDEKDWIGISATHLNANIVKAIFGNLSHFKLVDNPYVKVKTKKPLIFSGGYLPGNSSDFVSVLLAKTYGAKEIINMSNIDYVYDKDPKKYPEAKKIENISWREFLSIVGDKWAPGLNSPFDPIASKLCKAEKKKVVVLNGSNIVNLNNYFLNKKFKGTEIYD
ncbi:UMP kinase [Candidatus Falkowbacteria bacterium HGW-Falkowbacteria-1]|uniref:UMP kinase n=1 Tax=Candidatus Falkowbacteria bacterium HGW-Falkowbacteria-1 TaxID=2013768 RepID=A0A2N2EAJ3_9BACT|nr:MAG: UMP kinase [Candidatus Falkowbacteria bacterium HGW-Falkowbacteria-1]